MAYSQPSSDVLEKHLIDYYQHHQLQQFDMHTMIKELGLSTLEALHVYNTLNQNRQLITAYDHLHHSYMIEAFDQPLSNLVAHIENHRPFFMHAAEQLNISAEDLLWYYCESLGMKKDQYYQVKSKLSM